MVTSTPKELTVASERAQHVFRKRNH